MGKTALVTGASAGLGAELAALCAAGGHDVVLVARRHDRLEALGAELARKHGVKAHVIAADLADRQAPERLVAELAERGLDVDILINNAGFGTNGAFAELDVGRELDEVQVNVTALVHLTRLLLPGMIVRKHGRILNVGSTAGFLPGPFMAVYYATKAFVNSFSDALGYELQGTGVSVTLSCPGATATEFAQVAGSDGSRLFQGEVLGAAEVAEHAYLAMMAGEPRSIPGLKSKVNVLSLRLAPRRVALGIAAKMNRR